MQYELFKMINKNPKFPTTRYQGSKSKLIEWYEYILKDLKYNTVLDAFGGTGSVSYMFKKLGKEVTYNDILKFNYNIGKCLIENNSVELNKSDLEFLLKKYDDIDYPNFIHNEFEDIYFTTEENKWLDIIIKNISLLNNEYKKSIAYFALFQSCIIKRPYNLFHRKNLYVRTSDVKRSFGNKKTWDTPFEEHFKKFVKEANQAIFDNGKINKAINEDIFEINDKFDLVYIDSPYVSKNGTGVDYLDFYHFLEGIVNYDDWKSKINYNSKHKSLKRKKEVSTWANKKEISSLFEKLFEKFKDSIIVMAYRSDGIPAVEEICNMMKKYKTEVIKTEVTSYQYALSKTQTQEVLIIGK